MAKTRANEKPITKITVDNCADMIIELKKLGLIVEENYEINNVVYQVCITNPKNNRKLLINYNDVATHNTDVYPDGTLAPENEQPLIPRRYHLDQSENAENNGYELIQWFPHHNTDKMIEFIEAKLGMNEKVVGARKCKIKEVDRKVAKEFCENNHILGLNKKCDINVGLYLNDELISVMSFRTMNNTKANQKLIGRDNTENCWELFRFCNLPHHSVMGGAAKLFKYFLKTYNPPYVLTNSDYDLGWGSIYKQLGFTLRKKPTPQCYWTKPDQQYWFINQNSVLIGTDRILPKYVGEDKYFFVGMDREDFHKRGGHLFYKMDWPGNIQIAQFYGLCRVYNSGYKTWLYKNF